MAKKLGKNVEDIFAVSKRPKMLGRPIENDQPSTKVTVLLLDKQIFFLDKLANEIRLKKKAVLSRSEIIRKLVDDFEKSGKELEI